MFEFDAGATTTSGPFLRWAANGSQDGTIAPRSFAVADRDGTKEVQLKAAVFDVLNMRTGWQHSTGVKGVAPEWLWNESVARFAPRPDGDDWKRGFSISVALSASEKVVWEQASAGAWEAFKRLAVQLGDMPAGKLPVVKHDGVDLLKFAKGSTVVPRLVLVKYVEPPACLTDSAAGIVYDDGSNDDDAEF